MSDARQLLAGDFEIRISACPHIPAGNVGLGLFGRLVWFGPIGAPIEDGLFDHMLLNPADFERITAEIDEGMRGFSEIATAVERRRRPGA